MISSIKEYAISHIQKAKKLLDAHDLPHSIAGGTAIGMFFGFSPFLGIKTLCAGGVAALTRCNILAAVVGVSLHDILFPIMPIILRFEYDLGFWILSHPHHFPAKLIKANFTFHEFCHWKKFCEIGFPLALGEFLIAIPSAIITYFALLHFLKWKAARAARHPTPDQEATTPDCECGKR